MANNKDKGIAPYHDPYDSLLQNIFSYFGNHPNPTLADIWQSGGPSANSSSLPQQNNGNIKGNELAHGNRNGSNGTFYNNNPFSDPMIQDMGSFSVNEGGNFQVGPSELHVENSHPCPNDSSRTFFADDPFSDPVIQDMGTSSNNREGNFDAGPSELRGINGHPYPNDSNRSLYDDDSFSDPMIQDMGTSSINKGVNFEVGPSQLHGIISHPYPNGPGNSNGQMPPPPLCPEPTVAFSCSSCLVLREILHTNGVNIIKLEIHGRVGVICHAILTQTINVGSADSEYKFQMFDFSDKTFEEIKSFITNYCLQQTSSGYIPLQDPLSAYYEALCVDLNWTDFNRDLHHNSGTQSEETEQASGKAEEGMERLPLRTSFSLSSQRERATRMKLSDFSDYFHLPIEEAAKRVNLCPTVVKKICRKQGLGRWPHRKVKSIVRQISTLRKRLEIEDPSSRVEIHAEIGILYDEMVQHCGGVFPTAINFE